MAAVRATLPRQKRVRRSPTALRAEALIAARRLIVENPGQQLTMRSVADAVGVTYPNIAHHFGSAAGLYAAIGDDLVVELFEALKVTNDGYAASYDAAGLVDLVFDIFNRDGLGLLLEWLLRSSDPPAIEALKQAVATRIAEFNMEGENDPKASLRFRQMFIILGLTAYADVSAGAFLGDILGLDNAARRRVMAEAVVAIHKTPID